MGATNRAFRRAGASAAVLAALAVQPAFAQQVTGQAAPSEPQAAPQSSVADPTLPARPIDAASTPQAAEEAPAAGNEDDIIVTAQRREERLQDVPIVVSAVGAEALQTSGIVSTQQINVVVPGVSVRTSLGAFSPNIRGIGTTSNSVENPVALYIDDVYYPQQRDGGRELPDIEQLTVLKGPQGTLFGRNATGGVVQITTRAPSREFGGELKAEYGSYDTFRGSAYLTGGLAEDVAASLAVSYARQGEGFGRNLTTGNDTYRLLYDFSARAKLLWNIGPDTDATLIGDYSRRASLTNSFQPYRGTRPGTGVVGIGPLDSLYDTYSSTDPRSAYRSGGVSLNVNHAFDAATLTSITAYRQGNTQYLNEPTAAPIGYFVGRLEDGPNESFSQEVRLSSPGNDAFNWTLGGFYFWYDNTLNNFRRSFQGVSAPLPTSTALNDGTGSEIAESVAAFGQLTWTFLPGTRLTLGGRYTWEDRSLDGRVVLTRNNGTTATTDYNPRTSNNVPSWRVNLDHDFTDDVLGYVSWNRGVKSGGYNVQNPPNPAYEPERLDAYETGLKTEFLNGRVRLNAGLFYYDYTNIQVVQFIGAIQTVTNGAGAEVYGLDFEFNVRPSDRLRINGGVSLLHAEFSDYRNAVVSTPRPTGGALIGVGDATGNRLPLSQEITGNLIVNYDVPTSFGNINLNMTNSYNGDYFAEADNFLRQGEYVITNIGATWTSDDEKLSLTLFGRNIWDAKVASQLSTTALLYQAAYGGTIAESYGVSARLRF